MIKTFSNNTKFITGDRALEGLTFELQQNGVKKPLLICDDMSYRLGYLSELLRSFDSSDIRFSVIYKKVYDIPTVEVCEHLLKIYRANDCDGIVALGRGPVIECAKCIKIMLKDGMSFLSSYDNGQLSQYSIMRVPLFVVPTNLASGLEGSNSLRIYDVNNNKIYTFDTSFARSNIIVMDERMTDTMPPKQIVSYGCYALSMATMVFLEYPNEFVKPLATTALDLIRQNLFPCLLHNAKKNFRLNIMNAVVYAGIASDYVQNDIVRQLATYINDRYKCNFANAYMVLFRNYFKMREWDREKIEQLLLYLEGEDNFAMCNPVARYETALTSFEKVFDKIDDLVRFNSGLQTLGIEKSEFASIAEYVIQNTQNPNEESTYRFLVELLERSF